MRIHKANPHASLRMTGRLRVASAPEARGPDLYANAALKRRSSTGLQGSVAAPHKNQGQNQNQGQDQGQGQRRRTGVSDPHDQDQGQRQRARASALHDQKSLSVKSTKVDVYFSRLYVAPGACKSGISFEKCAATEGRIFRWGGVMRRRGRVCSLRVPRWRRSFGAKSAPQDDNAVSERASG